MWLLTFLAACSSSNDDQALVYPPSMTQVRVGEAALPEGIHIPESTWIPPLVVGSSWASLPNGTPGALDEQGSMDTLPLPALPATAGSWVTLQGALGDNVSELRPAFDDVEQGAAGTCYLLSSIISLGYLDDEMAFESALVRPSYRSDGSLRAYRVRFFGADGRPFDMEVDGRLASMDAQTPMFVRSSDSTSAHSELWISLVEKAYATWHGGYPNVEGGWPLDALHALTGKTGSRLLLWDRATDRSLVTYDQLRSTLYSLQSKKRAMVAYTLGRGDLLPGLVDNHAYAVLAVYEVAGETRVLLRNPWRNTEPTFDTDDDLTTPNDGSFELSLADFGAQFVGVESAAQTDDDHTAPAKIAPQVVLAGRDALALTWTAPGDDGQQSGAAAAFYDVRVGPPGSTTADFFDLPSGNAATPAAGGTTERLLIPFEAVPGDYVLMVQAVDESGNGGPISDPVTFTVLDANWADRLAFAPYVSSQSLTVQHGSDEWRVRQLFFEPTTARHTVRPGDTLIVAADAGNADSQGEIRVAAQAIDGSCAAEETLLWTGESGLNEIALSEYEGQSVCLQFVPTATYWDLTFVGFGSR